MAERNFWIIKGGKVAKGVVSFKWEQGMSTAQGRKSCANMHSTLESYLNLRALDISSASTSKLGISLSAFNLCWKGRTIECLYQGSKVYSVAGPMHKLYDATSMEAKLSMKNTNLGELVGFNLMGKEFPMEPRTVFYDWIYLQGLSEKFGKSLDVSAYDCFTDVKAVLYIDACQARAVCEYKLLKETGKLNVLEDFNAFLEWHKEHVEVPYEVELGETSVFYNKNGELQVKEKPAVIDSSYCVVYSDLFLDDMVALEELSRHYKNIYLITVKDDELEGNDYVSDYTRTVFAAVNYLHKWFDNVIMTRKTISENNVEVRGADCYSLANATKIVKDLEAGVKFRKIVASIGDKHEKEPNATEWNASQDVESYLKLLDYPIIQVTSNDCRERFAKREYGGGTYEFMEEYIRKMEAIKDEVCCFDLQAVLPM